MLFPPILPSFFWIEIKVDVVVVVFVVAAFSCSIFLLIYFCRSDGRVALHPSSVNSDERQFMNQWLVYLDKVMTFLSICNLHRYTAPVSIKENSLIAWTHDIIATAFSGSDDCGSEHMQVITACFVASLLTVFREPAFSTLTHTVKPDAKKASRIKWRRKYLSHLRWQVCKLAPSSRATPLLLCSSLDDLSESKECF